MPRALLVTSLALMALLAPRPTSAVLIPPDPAAASGAPTLTPRPPKAPYRDAILVCLPDDAGVTTVANGSIEMNDRRVRGILERLGRPSLERLGRNAAPGRPLFARIDMTGRGGDIESTVRALRATGLFRAVVPDVRVSLLLVPNDPYYVDQWYVQQAPGDPDIDLIPAWDLETGNAGIKIAILDTGVDTGHPDLASRIAVNAGEIAGNGLDDDGNGFTDDDRGWDFGDGDRDANPEPFWDPSGLDAGFHGTFCAGLAGAATNNGIGIAGAGFNCRILPVKVSNAVSDIPLSAITGGIDYAVSRQASVISMSFGARGDGVPEYFQALVDMATNAGVLCVAAAGNDTSDVPTYPAACNHVLAVGANDDNGARAFFSNYGSWVDVSAPGATIWSSICRNYEADFVSQLFYLLFFGWDGENPYMYGDGTSFACPLVAGACGLVRAHFPSATPDAIIQHMVDTADPVSYDLPMGPRVNTYQALLQPVSGVPEARPGAARLVVRAGPNPLSAATRLSFELPRAGRVTISVVDAAGRLVTRPHDGPMAAGPQSLEWNATRSGGVPVAAGIYFARVEAGEQVGVVRLAVRR